MDPSIEQVLQVELILQIAFLLLAGWAVSWVVRQLHSDLRARREGKQYGIDYDVGRK